MGTVRVPILSGGRWSPPSLKGGRAPIVALLCSVFLMMLVSACSGSSTTTGTSQPGAVVNGGSWYVRYQWPHDGKPYESQHFVVYSDAASQEARIAAAELGEQLLAETIAQMGISANERFRFPPGQDKIDIYAFKDQFSEEWAAKAYYAGLLIFSLDHEQRSASGHTDPETYEAILKHELVHVVESLLKGEAAGQEHHTDVWFSEGLAEAMSGGTGSGVIRGMDDFNQLTSQYGQLNPIAYMSDAQVVGGVDAYSNYHYPMWQLAVEYLMDEYGLANTPADAAAVFAEMGDGSSFQAAFDAHMGTTLAEYEEQFFGRIAGYLPALSGSIAFTPLGLVLISLIAVGIAVTSSIRNVRSSPAATAADPATESDAPTRGSRVAFSAWMIVAVTLSLFLFLRGVSEIGGSRTLEDGEKVLGLAVLIAYLGASTAVLTWAARRRRQHSGAAWLIPLLAIVTAGTTIIAIDAIF